MNTEQTDHNPLSDIEQKIKQLYDELSPEHKQFLENYNAKLTQILQGSPTPDPYYELDNDNPLDLNKKHPEILHPKHLSDAPHEIVVYVKAEVSDIDNKGNLSQVKDLCEQYYHIPVPAGRDYSLYMTKFFEKFHSNLELACQEANTEKKDV